MQNVRQALTVSDLTRKIKQILESGAPLAWAKVDAADIDAIGLTAANANAIAEAVTLSL